MRAWLTKTISGLALSLGVIVKLLALILRAAVGSTSLIEGLDTAGSVSLVVAAIGLSVVLFRKAKRVVLWQVRLKLILSYVFTGLVPALLIVLFFVVCGLLLFFNVGSYLMRSRLQALGDQASFLALSTTLELERARSEADFANVLQRRQAAASARYPHASYAVVRTERACDAEVRAPESSAAPAVLAAGPWAHLDAPRRLPAWMRCEGRAGLLAYYNQTSDWAQLVVRATMLPESRAARYAVVVDLPVGNALKRQLLAETGIRIGNMIGIEEALNDVAPVNGRALEGESDVSQDASLTVMAGPLNVVIGEEARGELRWVTPLDYTDWESGRTGTLSVTFQMNPLDTYRRISTTSLGRISNLSFGQIVLITLAIVAGLFLIIQAVAFMMGLALARSITGSVHELFAGTERVRRGDFAHKIAIRSRDQLGELAASFNLMTASIEELLQQKAEKERLEQELRIARKIQMSLLPQGPLSIPGIALTGHCEPAREVGGDYYDFLPLDEQRIGILIADVAGKGTSAALYMAELKGLVHSLSLQHASPRQLLIDANRIISRHLHAGSFITMTYAVVDLQARTLTYARAGHLPMVYVPGPHATSRVPQLLLPDGMVLGLQIDTGDMFSRVLEEATLPLDSGDLFLLYTDGISEASNEGGEFFGDSRLADLMATYADLESDELCRRILHEVRTFTGPTAQQDDMTMVLLRVQ